MDGWRMDGWMDGWMDTDRPVGWSGRVGEEVGVG